MYFLESKKSKLFSKLKELLGLKEWWPRVLKKNCCTVYWVVQKAGILANYFCFVSMSTYIKNQLNYISFRYQSRQTNNYRGGVGREMGGRFKREGIYVYLWLIHVEVWQKTAKSCKAIILQLKIIKNLKINLFKKNNYFCKETLL